MTKNTGIKKSKNKSNQKKFSNLMLAATVTVPGIVGVGGDIPEAKAAGLKYTDGIHKFELTPSGGDPGSGYITIRMVGGGGNGGKFTSYGSDGIPSEDTWMSDGVAVLHYIGGSWPKKITFNGAVLVPITNTAPNIPTLNIPVQQFEHMDKHVISWTVDDPEGDELNSTLYAAYNGTDNWIPVYSGKNKNFEYTVPTDKSSVKFKLMVSDGELTVNSAESVVKSIRPVTYYWNKFNAASNNKFYLQWDPSNSYGSSMEIPVGNAGGYLNLGSDYGYSYNLDSEGRINILGTNHMPHANYGQTSGSMGTLYRKSGSFLEMYEYNINNGFFGNNGWVVDFTVKSTRGMAVTNPNPSYYKGTLVQGNIEGTFDSYQHGVRNPDGYWYERGQRQLGEDTTPPIIELEEQKDYSLTPIVTVHTYDAGKVQTVKWAKGNLSVLDFVNGGTEIATGQSTPSSFTVSENGIYTVFAVDEKGNKTVQTINVTKVNQKPEVSKNFETITIQGKGKNEVIDLNMHFKDPDGHPLKFEVVSSSEAHVKAEIENRSQLKVTGVSKGKSKLTITADDGYETTTIQVDVAVSNTKPTITVKELPNHVVLDDQTHFTIDGTATDEDSDALTAKVEHFSKELTAPVTDGKFSVKYQGNQVSKGYHHEAMQVTVSDGLEDSEVYTAALPIIKVDEATNYTNEMAGHQDTYNSWTPEQHEAFYNGYESIFNYETVRTEEALTRVKDVIAALQAQTVKESETITNWENRLFLVTATVATESAEKSLIKDDYKHAEELVEALTSSAEKEALEERINELQRYHDANNAILVMEDNHGSISWDSIKDTQDKVEVVENAANKKDLEDRLSQVIKDYISNLETVTPDDLDKFGVSDVNTENSDLYDEFKDAFKPIGENHNAQDLVNFVNALKVFLSDVTQSALDTLHSNEPSYSQDMLKPVLTTADELILYRQTFKREVSKDKTLSDKVQTVDFQQTKEYMQTIVKAMQEVIEYNDTHDEQEKSEGYAATDVLWEGQLRKDMQAYLDNGIPDIIVLDDRYEYINNGQLHVVATINDSDDSEHDVTVTFNGESKTVKTADGKVAVTYDLADGVYDGFVEIEAKDKLTERKLTIANKPVVTVSDVEMFKRFVQALEADLGSSFDEMEQTTITSLKMLFDKTLAIKVNVSSEREIREVENTATKLGGKNGQLESLVKLLVQNNRLEWLINNYKIATDDDFTWAGVVGVTPDNIGALKSIIDDYVASFEDRAVKTPSLEDYQSWLNLSTIIEEARMAIEIAEGLHIKDELDKAISTAKEKLFNVPEWLTVKNVLKKQLDAVIAYSKVIESVMNSEISYQQTDKDAALLLVEQLPDGTPKDSLLYRLEIVQTVIDATLAVGNAEISLEEADQLVAQALVDEIDSNIVKKTELQERLDALSKLKEAIAALEQADLSKAQTDLDVAKELVEALPESPKKEELLDRVKELQDVIDNKSKEDQAKDAVNKVEDSLLEADRDKAQEKVDALEDGQLKDELQDRLDEIQTHVDAYKSAREAVEKAEVSKDKADIDSAQQLVDVLPNSKAKMDLQERLDVISLFIQAEQGVSKAEVSLIQKHKNEAQKLVDALPKSEEKTALQNRLDALQILIDNKKEDLLNKIINDLDSVTSNEFADYTGEKVYEELMPNYREAIDKLGDSVTKEQVINVVKLINALELAKREMKLEFIIAYQKEYADSSILPTLDNYPQPAALSSVVDYLQDDSALEQVIKEIAIALKVSEDEIRMEIEKILKDVSNDATTTGKYLVQYVSEEDGEVVAENWITEVPYGEVEVVGQAPEGYEIVGDPNQSFTLSDETTEHVISFVIKVKQEENLPETNEQDTEEVQPNDGLESEQNTEEDDNDAKEFDDNHEEEVEVPSGQDTPENTDMAQSEGENVVKDIIQVDKLTVDFIQTSLLEILNLSSIQDDVLSLYVQHINDYATESGVTEYTLEELSVLFEAIQAAYGQEIGAEDKISKLVNGPVKETLFSLIKPKSTIGPEASIVRSKMMVASLNDSYLRVSSTPYAEWGTENENHAEYVFKTFYALASVKSYKSSPSDKYKLEVKDYIVKELHKGSYKALLLSELGYSVEEIGDEGKTDLTVVTPTPPPVKPPVVEPPVVEPPVIGPPVVVEPPSVVNPQPKPPVVKPELPEGTVAETIDYDNNGKWTIKNPAKEVVTLEQDGIQIKIPLELQAKLWEVEWILKSNQHYQLRILADGKEITVFKKPIEITKTSKKAYVFRFENGQYTAIPFTFAVPNQIQFKVTKTGEFQFSTKRITFKDIDGVFSQRAIEELASRHIVKGTAPDYYSPYESLTRAQFSAMLVRSLGIDTSNVVNGVFKDVKAKDWFANDVQALYETGIIRGVTAKTFNPNSPLTRQQAALMLDRALDYLKIEKSDSTTLNFKDANKISEEAKPAVATMQTLGIFSGKEGNKFDPHANLTRAEMAKVLQLTLELAGLF